MLPVIAVLRDSMVKDIKGWKILSRIRKVVKKHYNHHTSFQKLNKNLLMLFTTDEQLI